MSSTVKEVIQIAIGVSFAIWIFGTIAKKAGYSRWIGLIMLIPAVNVIGLIWFAHSEWPIESALQRLRHGESEIATSAIWREGF